MNERERLICLLHNAPYGAYNSTLEDTHTDGAIEEITDYLLSNGVIVLPYKIGDTVYRINSVWLPEKVYDGLEEHIQIVEHTEVIESTLKRNDISINEAYLTREEAEKAKNSPIQARDLHRITI